MLHRLNLALVLFLLAGSLWLANRHPGAFTWEWWMMPLLAVVTTAGMDVLRRYTRRDARFVNLPDKERLLRLPPERQAAVLARVDEMVLLTQTVTLVTFLLVQGLMYAEAFGRSTTGWTVAVLVVAVGTTPLLLATCLPRIYGELKRQERAAKAEAPQADVRSQS